MSKARSNAYFLSQTKIQPQLPLFVFIPGMDGTGQLLRSQTVGLEVAFDVRCLSLPPDDLPSWEQLSEQVLALIDAELQHNSQRVIYLGGESFGACLAMKVAVQSPHLFDRLILINSASAFALRPLLAWGSQITQWLPPNFYRLSANVLLPFLAALERVSPRDRRALLESIDFVPLETVLWRLSLLRNFDVERSQLQQFKQPVLLVASQADRIFPSVEEARRLLNIFPNTVLVELPFSGHACLIESQVNLYQIMKDHNFLGSNVAPVYAQN